MNRKSRHIARSANEGEAEHNRVFKAVLIYENVAAGARAWWFLERLARASGKTLEEQMRNFGVLGIRKVRNEAASAARKADVVGVSPSSQRESHNRKNPGSGLSACRSVQIHISSGFNRPCFPWPLGTNRPLFSTIGATGPVDHLCLERNHAGANPGSNERGNCHGSRGAWKIATASDASHGTTICARSER